jgi:uncharacterized flavoprotein (TIGR03862 family)
MGQIAIIGAGPAGLIAAEKLAERGHDVTIFDHMPQPGRKFLLAGRGGLNITHSEPREQFMPRYGSAAAWLAPCIDAFSPDDLRAWCEGLEQTVFVGSSGRIFPQAFKAAPLLRAWLRRLEALGVRFMPRHRWVGFSSDMSLRIEGPSGVPSSRPDAVLLALGGASWPRMGSDGGWVEKLRACGIGVADLHASNCGVLASWSHIFAMRFEGQALKRIAATAGETRVRGEAVITRAGLEGGAIYALSAPLRDALMRGPTPNLLIDLLPDASAEAASAKLGGPRQGRSLGNFLRQSAGLSPAAIGLVQEAIHRGTSETRLSRLVKAVPIPITGLQPIERAISSAGGIQRDSVDEFLMLRALPGVFVAGEMLDWEAPTGGYLLQACFSTGVLAATGMSRWLDEGKEAVLF